MCDGLEESETPRQEIRAEDSDTRGVQSDAPTVNTRANNFYDLSVTLKHCRKLTKQLKTPPEILERALQRRRARGESRGEDGREKTGSREATGEIAKKAVISDDATTPGFCAAFLEN